MKNIKMKKTLVALILTMSIAGSAIAFSGCNKEEASDETKEETTTTTVEETEEETEAEVELSDATVKSLKEEKEADGCTIEIIDADSIGADASEFVEGFKATGGSQDGEFVCAKFTDAEVAKTFVKEVLSDGSWGMSTFNDQTSFNVDSELEGTIDKDGVLCYYPYSEDDTTTEDFFEVKAENYNDPELQKLCQKYIDEGCTMMDAGEEVEGFIAYANLDSDDPVTLIECLKFDSAADAKAYIEETVGGADVDFTEDADGSFTFTTESSMGSIEGSVSAEGLFVAESVFS